MEGEIAFGAGLRTDLVHLSTFSVNDDMAFPASSGRVIRFVGSWPGSAFSSRHTMRVSMIGRIFQVSLRALLREPLS